MSASAPQGLAAQRKAQFENLKSPEIRARGGSIGGNVDANIQKYNVSYETEDLDFRTGNRWTRRLQSGAVSTIENRVYSENWLPTVLRKLIGLLPMVSSRSSGRNSNTLSSAKTSRLSSQRQSRIASTRSSRLSSWRNIGPDDEPELHLLFQILLFPIFLLAELIEAPIDFFLEHTVLSFVMILALGVASAAEQLPAEVDHALAEVAEQSGFATAVHTVDVVAPLTATVRAVAQTLKASLRSPLRTGGFPMLRGFPASPVLSLPALPGLPAMPSLGLGASLPWVEAFRGLVAELVDAVFAPLILLFMGADLLVSETLGVLLATAFAGAAAVAALPVALLGAASAVMTLFAQVATGVFGDVQHDNYFHGLAWNRNFMFDESYTLGLSRQFVATLMQ